MNNLVLLLSIPVNSGSQRKFLLSRRLQKIEHVKPNHCDRYQNNRTKNAIEWHWSPTSERVRTLVKFQ